MKSQKNNIKQLEKERLRKIKAERAKPTTQNTIKYLRMIEDGICEVEKGVFSKTIKFADINYEIAKKESRNAMLVEKMEDLYLNYVGRFKKVGIIAEKSTSKDLIDTVVQILKNTKTEEYMYEE